MNMDHMETSLTRPQATRPTPDLPVELWLEILSYHPPHFISKMVGVNRFLHEMAMNWRYEEVRLVGCDKRDEIIFEQLRDENVGKRLRHLYIRPSFLPALDGGPSASSHWERQQSLYASVTRLSNWVDTKIRRSRSGPLSPPCEDTAGTLEVDLSEDFGNKLFKTAVASIVHCSNLSELSIVVYDHLITPAFSAFLAALASVVGTNLRRLAVHTTVTKLPTLLGGITAKAAQVPNLGELDLIIVNSRFAVTSDEAKTATDAMVAFCRRFKATLSRISLSTVEKFDLSPFLGRVGVLPHLRRLELSIVMCSLTLSDDADLETFLKRNASTLEHLVLNPRPKFTAFFPLQDKLQAFIDSHLPNLRLSNVRSFETGLCFRNPDGYPKQLLQRTFPNLRSLALTEYLQNENFASVMDDIAKSGCALEELKIMVPEFSPEVLDAIALKGATIRTLELTMDTHSLMGMHQGPGTWGLSYGEIESRRYPHWALRRLRIGKPGTCREIHPSKGFADAVASTIVDREVEKDMERRCFCHRSAYAE